MTRDRIDLRRAQAIILPQSRSLLSLPCFKIHLNDARFNEKGKGKERKLEKTVILENQPTLHTTPCPSSIAPCFSPPHPQPTGIFSNALHSGFRHIGTFALPLVLWPTAISSLGLDLWRWKIAPATVFSSSSGVLLSSESGGPVLFLRGWWGLLPASPSHRMPSTSLCGPLSRSLCSQRDPSPTSSCSRSYSPFVTEALSTTSLVPCIAGILSLSFTIYAGPGLLLCIRGPWWPDCPA